MAAGDLILTNVTLTQADLDSLASTITGIIQTTAKDPSDFDTVSSLDNITSLPCFQLNGSTFKLVRVLISVLKGIDGKSVELQATDTYLQWRSTDGTTTTAWANLVDLTKLKGSNGVPAVYRKGTTGIEWKLQDADDSTYAVLITYDELKVKFSDLTTAEIQTIWDNVPDTAVALFQQPATEAAASANSAASAANAAASAATSAADNANTKASAAQAAADKVNTAVTNANNATTAANDAANAANIAKTNADTATAAANQAKTDANTAAANADAATTAANKAASSANTAASAATTAANAASSNASSAQAAADNATNAANAANSAAGSAINAAQSANSAAANVTNGKTPVFESGSITTLTAGSNATGTVVENGQDTNGNPIYKLNFGVPKGADGSLGAGDAKDLTVSFAESATRVAIASGESIATLFGKIKKWFTDFAAVAFSGNYNDLTNKPTIPTVPTNVSSFNNDSNYQTNANVNDLIGAHNTSASAHQDIRTSLSNIQAIAEGKSRARVFATVAALDTWLSDSANTALLQIGDNFYITATDVPDYWWDGSAKQKLETEKVSLTEYQKTADADTKYVAKVSGLTAKSSGLYKITTNADGIVTAVVEVSKSDLTALGIPAQDTTYDDAYSTDASHAVHGLLPAADKIKLDNFTNNAINDLNRNLGYTSTTTLVSVPISKRLVKATLSAATNLSLESDLSTGQEIHIICTPSAAFTQPIPNSGSWISMDGSSLKVTSGVPFELNILFDGTYYRVKVITQS